MIQLIVCVLLILISYFNLGIEDISGFSMRVHEHVSPWRYNRKMQFLSTVVKKDAENIYLNYGQMDKTEHLHFKIY